jgi:hypothetical protein
VLGESLCGKEEHFELAHRPPHFGRAVLVLLFEPDVVGDVLDDLFYHDAEADGPKWPTEQR